MYQIIVRLKGTAPLLQHAFTAVALEGLMQAAGNKAGKPDYSREYLDTMYRTADGMLYQPASHFEGSLVKAATRFQMKGKTSFKDTVKAYVYAQPEQILHIRNGEYVPAPDETLIHEPTEYLRVNVSRVVVNRSAVARSRLEIAPGWELAFRLEVIEDIVQAKALEQFLTEAGRAVGIGDYRPRYGRFEVIQFDVA